MSRTDYMDVEPALLVFYGALTIAITLSRTSSRPELPLMVGLVMLPVRATQSWKSTHRVQFVSDPMVG